MSKTSTKQSTTYKEHQRKFYKFKTKVQNNRLELEELDMDWILQERLEERLLMKKLKETNIDSIHGVTDVIELVTEKPLEQLNVKKRRNKWDYPSTYFYHEDKPKETKQISYEWVYRNYERFGNVYVSEATFKKIDLGRLGKFKKAPSLNLIKNVVEGYVLWKEK